MKTRSILSLILFFWIGNVAIAQIELPESTKEALENYNKEMKDKEGENPDKDDVEKAKKEKQWQKEWEDAKKKYGDASGAFHTKELNCVFLMVLYIYGYESLVDKTNKEEFCPRKYDLLGTQAAAIAMSTTIMYCPESIANLNDAEFRYGVFDPLMEMSGDKNKSSSVDQWFKLLNAMIEHYVKKNYPNESLKSYMFSDFLLAYFRPEYVVSRSIEIANEMEALGCGDY